MNDIAIQDKLLAKFKPHLESTSPSLVYRAGHPGSHICLGDQRPCYPDHRRTYSDRNAGQCCMGSIYCKFYLFYGTELCRCTGFRGTSPV